MIKYSFIIILTFILTPLWAQSESDFIVTFTTDRAGVVITDYIGRSPSDRPIPGIEGGFYTNPGSPHPVRIPTTIQNLPVKEIGDRAFRGKDITSVIIPEGVTKIGNYSFSSCSYLSSVTFPNTLTHISEFAFSGCRELRTITIPSNVTFIGQAAFSNTGLTSINWPSRLTTIPNAVFAQTSLQSIVIPEGVTIIADFAFSNCTSLTSVTLPSTIVEIGSEAFRNCSALFTLNIPTSISNIRFVNLHGFMPHNSFEGCNRIPLATQARLRDLGYEGNF